MEVVEVEVYVCRDDDDVVDEDAVDDASSPGVLIPELALPLDILLVLRRGPTASFPILPPIVGKLYVYPPLPAPDP